MIELLTSVGILLMCTTVVIYGNISFLFCCKEKDTGNDFPSSWSCYLANIICYLVHLSHVQICARPLVAICLQGSFAAILFWEELFSQIRCLQKLLKVQNILEAFRMGARVQNRNCENVLLKSSFTTNYCWHRQYLFFR